MTWGKKTNKDGVRSIFTENYFYLYSQPKFGDVKLYFQIPIIGNEEFIKYLSKH